MQLNKRRIGLTAALLLGAGCISTSVQAQTTIPASSARPKTDADQRGFLWRVYQVDSGQPNDNQRTEKQLAGLLGDNVADPAAQGVANGAGKVTGPKAPIEFQIDSVINLDQSAGSNGSFTPDDQMPGIPGTGGSLDNIAAEILFWLDLDPGTYTFIVNSDDGFAMQMGGASPTDGFHQLVGQFNGGRGASDTSFDVVITQAGLYPARITWEEGGSGANIEFVVNKGGTKFLVNADDSGIKAYRSVKGAAGIQASTVTPNPGATGVSPGSSVEVTLQNVGTLNASDVKLSLDGADTGAVATKTGDSINIKFTPASLFASASKHSASLTYGTAKTDWDFTVATYQPLNPAVKVTPDTSKPGFIWNIFGNAANTANSNATTEDALAGNLKDADGNPLPNNADPAAQGVASGPGKKLGTADNSLIQFEIPTIINVSQTAGDSHGSFPNEDQMPGVPQTDGSMDGMKVEILTFLELPAGVTTMVVNSDDGFKTGVGEAGDVFNPPQTQGEFSGGRGAADTSFSVVVPEAGVYPFRTTYEEGGGDANIEWFTIKADGTKVLINDTANGGIKAYRAKAAGSAKARGVSASPAPGQGGVAYDAAINLVLEEGDTAIDTATVGLKLDGAATTPTVTKSGKQITINFKPAAAFAPKSRHTVTLNYTEGGTVVTRDWFFVTLNTDLLAYWDFNDASDPKKAADKAGGHTASFVATAAYSADAGGHTAKAGDRALQLPTDGTDGERAEVRGDSATFFLNDAGIQDSLAISFWQKLEEVRNSSAFWSGGPSSDRYFQAHAPWGDSTIYFDTVACCDGTQRISASLNDWADAGGDPTSYLANWHFFVFQKNGPNKQIYIDGKLFLEGQNTAKLPTNFNAFEIGTFNGGSSTHGLIDDVALYATALSTDEINKLFTGTTPDKLGRTTPGAQPGNVEFTKVSFTNGKLHVEWSSGKLQKADSILGPWTDVAGATSPRDIDPTGPAAFYRLVP